MPSKKITDKLRKQSLEELDEKQLVEHLEDKGYLVTAERPTEKIIKVSRKQSGKFRFSVVSDTHFGHKCQQLTHLTDFYNRAEEWGSEFMLHCGDVVDGQRMHRDQEFELFRHGVEAQGTYAAEVMPVLWKDGKPMQTYMIGGNHDGSGWNSAGANVLKVIAQNREHKDVKVVGAPTGLFTYGPVKILLMHPDGGPSYAHDSVQSL